MDLGLREAGELLGIPRSRVFRWITFLPRFADHQKYLPFPKLTVKDLTLLAVVQHLRKMGVPLRTAIKGIHRIDAEWDGQAAPAGNLLVANGHVAFGPFTFIAEGIRQPLTFWPGLVNLSELTDRVALLIDEWQASQEVDNGVA